jgi:hypothetical protein
MDNAVAYAYGATNAPVKKLRIYTIERKQSAGFSAIAEFSAATQADHF